MSLVDESVEALVHCLSNHFSTRHQLGVELVEDVLEVITLNCFLCVEQIEEFLNELGCHKDLKRSNFDGLVHDQIEEKLVNSLEIWPGRVNFFFLVDTSLSKIELSMFYIREWAEDILLDHLHNLFQRWNNDRHYLFLIGE